MFRKRRIGADAFFKRVKLGTDEGELGNVRHSVYAGKLGEAIDLSAAPFNEGEALGESHRIEGLGESNNIGHDASQDGLKAALSLQTVSGKASSFAPKHSA